MKALSQKEGTIFQYGLWFLAGGLLIVVTKYFPEWFSISPIFLIFSLYLFLLPGWLLSRFLRLDRQGWINQILISFILSLSFYLLINLLAIFLAINLNQLLNIYYILMPVLFVGAFLFELWQPENQPALNRPQIWLASRRSGRTENLLYLLPIILGAIIFLVVDAKGADFNGDPYLHLSIIRKAVEGRALNLQNLALIKVYGPNPAYAFPAWHVLVALFSQLTSLNIFTVWSKLTLPLMIFSFFAWYGLIKVIFPSRPLRIFSLLIFMIFLFGPSAGYFFQRIILPDSFARLVVVPLTLTFGLQYILKPKLPSKTLLVFGLGAISLLLIHGLHYFYLLFLLISFLIFWSIWSFRDQHFLLSLKRGLLVFATAILPVSVLIFILELKSKIVSTSLSNFRAAPPGNITYLQFKNFPLIYKYGYFLTPLVVLFAKNRSLIFIFSAMVISPLVYWTPLKDILSRYLSQIFVNRLFVNTSIYFLVIALILGFLVISFENYLSRFFKKTVNLFTLLLIFGLGFLIYSEIKNRSPSAIIDYFVFSRDFSLIINQAIWLIFGAVILVTLLLGFWIKFIRGGDFKPTAYFKNNLNGFLLILIVSFMFLAPSFAGIGKALKTSQFFSMTDYTQKAYALSEFGNDLAAIEFLKTQIPPKSVILADKVAARSIAMLADQYLAYNLGSFRQDKLTAVFSSALSPEEKAQILFSPKYLIDYVYLRLPQEQSAEYFTNHPDLYQKIYSGKVQIYQVIR